MPPVRNYPNHDTHKDRECLCLSLSVEGPHWRSASYRQNRASRGRNDFVRGSDWQVCCLAATETNRASHAKNDEVRFPMIGDCQDLIGCGTLPNYTMWFAPQFGFRRHDLPQAALSSGCKLFGGHKITCFRLANYMQYGPRIPLLLRHGNC